MNAMRRVTLLKGESVEVAFTGLDGGYILEFGEVDLIIRDATCKDVLFSRSVCPHKEWDHGFSMNGPTRTCKACGKFERD